MNADFLLPKDFTLIKKLGSGAFGKVMQILHIPTGREYACKRFEDVFESELRAKRLLREINILKLLNHPCINKLKCVIPPESLGNKAESKYGFDHAYLVLRRCDMDLKKLLKSNRHLEED